MMTLPSEPSKSSVRHLSVKTLPTSGSSLPSSGQLEALNGATAIHRQRELYPPHRQRSSAQPNVNVGPADNRNTPKKSGGETTTGNTRLEDREKKTFQKLLKKKSVRSINKLCSKTLYRQDAVKPRLQLNICRLGRMQ